MASIVARALPGRLARTKAHSRVFNERLRRAAPSTAWVCYQCVRKTANVVSGRRPYSIETPVRETPDDINSLPDSSSLSSYAALDTFPRRHIGPDNTDTLEMLKALDPPVQSLDDFVAEVLPANIRAQEPFKVDEGVPKDYGNTESGLLASFNKQMRRVKPLKTYHGQGYYRTITPGVIQRNILENPAWYTSYTPYQPEISQGRLESLLNFQTMVCDLTALPIANASLLDEGTAAAEAMTLSMNALPSSRAKRPGKTYVVSSTLHPQTVAVMGGRAEGFGIALKQVDFSKEDSTAKIEELGEDLVGVMVQYPDTLGQVADHQALADLVHRQGALLSVATDLLALTVLKPPGEWGADIAFGNAQRFGVPLGFGGPHAAFFSVTEKHKRKIPGRLVGLSRDRLGRNAYRLALQTREQHIRREKATSNVCTSQALLANMSAMYAIYHGPEGLKAIAERVIRGARAIQAIAEACGFNVVPSQSSLDGRAIFDTITIDLGDQLACSRFFYVCRDFDIEIRKASATTVALSADETLTRRDLVTLVQFFRRAREALDKGTIEGKPDEGLAKGSQKTQPDIKVRKPSREITEFVGDILTKSGGEVNIPDAFRRTSSYLTHPIFNTHHSETEMLRYIYHLQSKDLSLVHSMIPLGSCTMKLNATTEMALITHPAIANMHPLGKTVHINSLNLKKILTTLMSQLSQITGMQHTSLQPNSGAQGEFAGLRAIRSFHVANGHKNRDICLIPVSAHGTNPASAAMAGMRVVPIKCDTITGNLDLEDLTSKCIKHQEELGAIMITYPSTFGVFEPEVKKVCQIVHDHGGQVYMDGANMNAQIGLCSPGEIGADVCHLNLHKTFCIPHGGGGPGVGPICVKEHLHPFLPRTRIFTKTTKADENGIIPAASDASVSSAPYGSASINLISWAYNSLMGAEGLAHATKMTLLNANYILSRLKPHYSILYVNEKGRCAHEFILDARPFGKTAGVEAIDIAKRLQDYGFHAPTMSWPVANTLMIEPTESESKEELDRFIDALISIRQEIREIEEGTVPRDGNVLKMAPHPMQDLIQGDGEGKWERSYSREKAAYPLPFLKEKKFWPSVARIDDTYGDLNLFCTCPPVEDTTEC